MKRKWSLFVNIGLVCLCLCAIAVGVYSAKTASLSINGSVNFEAHDCDANITTTLYGDSVKTVNGEETETATDGQVRRTAKTYSVVQIRGEDANLRLGDIFFCDLGTVNDKPAPIKITFQVENISNFSIKAEITLPTNLTGVTALANKDSIQIESGATGSIMLTFTVNDDMLDSGLETAMSLTGTKLTLSKYTFTKSQIPVKTETLDTGETGYYIEYGTSSTDSATILPWYIMGVYNGDNNGNNETFTKLDVSQHFNCAEGSYTMKDNLTYALVSKYALFLNSSISRMPFNNNWTICESAGYSNEFVDVQANDYSISTIRSYLLGANVYFNVPTKNTGESFTNSTGTYSDCVKYSPDLNYEGNYYSFNILKFSDIYTLIKTRTLSSLYAGITKSSDAGDLPTDGITTEGVLATTDSDAFWLLSYGEATTLFSSNDERKVTFLTGTSASWWLRTPHSDTKMLYSIYDDGHITTANANSNVGLLPAFLI